VAKTREVSFECGDKWSASTVRKYFSFCGSLFEGGIVWHFYACVTLRANQISGSCREGSSLVKLNILAFCFARLGWEQIVQLISYET
jgi:hypothetical protein